ncbi:MAG: hypothetical protein HY216_05530, partial [Candidatus Rokubacteria bacterium]|nr:hypothetical protein [Candidatus Rokubacteria bacterium]
PDWRVADAPLALLGTYQPGNALLAAAAARVVGAGETAIRAGLARARWPGRFQVVRGDPTLVLDGAHNPAGAEALARSLREYFGTTALTLIVGVMRDKDAGGILAPLLPLAARVILTAPGTPRAASPQALSAALPATARASAQIAPSVAEALEMAHRDPRTPIVCVAGSVHLVGDALAHLVGPDKPCSIENGADSMDSLFS